MRKEDVMIHVKYTLMGMFKFAAIFALMWLAISAISIFGFWTIAIPAFIGASYLIGWIHYNMENPDGKRKKG